MSYVRLIPSMVNYAENFKHLDSLDFAIIKAICKLGFSNINTLAEHINIPQQTVSYHLKKLDKKGLVHFRALTDEAKLGLKSYVVIATSPLGKEDFSSRATTCFPLWRYLAIVDGWKRGSYLRYVIPSDKERDLKVFLEELARRNVITDFEFLPSTTPNYPLLNLDFYAEKKGIPVFDWENWVKDYDFFHEAELDEPKDYGKTKFDLFDLIILRCLEIDVRTKQKNIVKQMARILGDKDEKKYIPLVSRRIRESIVSQCLVRGLRAYLFPNPAPTALFLMYHLIFSSASSLQRFVTGLSNLPYNTGFEKILGRDELFVRFIIPVHEFSKMRKAFMQLAENGYLKDAHLFFGSLTSTWDNVEIHQMFKDGMWNFSFGIAMEMFEKIIAQEKH